jgi:hypothetical protein
VNEQINWTVLGNKERKMDDGWASQETDEDEHLVAGERQGQEQEQEQEQEPPERTQEMMVVVVVVNLCGPEPEPERWPVKTTLSMPGSDLE